jgi:hypothetical protein
MVLLLPQLQLINSFKNGLTECKDITLTKQIIFHIEKTTNISNWKEECKTATVDILILFVISQPSWLSKSTKLFVNRERKANYSIDHEV